MKNFNVKDVIIEDLDGNIYPLDLGKTVGNLVYVNTSNLDWDIIARAIHKSEPVELLDEQLIALQSIIISDKSNLILMAKIALNKYIEKLIEAN